MKSEVTLQSSFSSMFLIEKKADSTSVSAKSSLTTDFKCSVSSMLVEQVFVESFPSELLTVCKTVFEAP
jgi:hypothetical protein